MKFDFLISASPNDGFFSQIAFFKLCLDRIGGDYANARIVAVFGDHNIEAIPGEWRRYFEDIEVEWAHPLGAVNPHHRAQHDRRFEIIRQDADLAFLCDADVALMTPLDDLVHNLIARPALAGVIAHYHFPWHGRVADPNVDWPEISIAVIGRDIDRPYRYSLLGKDTPPVAPFYINYGFLAGSPGLLKEFYLRDRQLRPLVADLIGHWWAPQVSLALTCADLQLPTVALPMRYNFPNDPVADNLYPEELDGVLLMHYLRLNEFKRDEIWVSENKFLELIESRFHGSNEIFRNFVKNATNGNYPFYRQIP